MCLVVTAWRAHPKYLLVLAANRDEFYARKSIPVHWWGTTPDMLAGRDVSPQGGGTWMGLSHNGRFAAVTNYREPGHTVLDAHSRGELPANFVLGALEPQEHLAEVAGIGNSYNGFNLLVSDMQTLWWCSNRAAEPRRLEPGFYGVSNAFLDTPWPKVTNSVERLRAAVATDFGGSASAATYFDLLSDTTLAPDDQLPATGLPHDLERLASAAFIASPDYGTNSSTVLRVRYDGLFDLEERRFDASGPTGTRRLEGTITLDRSEVG